VVVAGSAAQRQGLAGVAAGRLQQFGPQFALQERIGLADIDQQVRGATAALDEGDGVVLARCGFVGAKVSRVSGVCR
jgi:hypothetical protein